MATIVLVDIGSTPNDGTGDALRNAFNAINTALTTLNNAKSETSHNHDAVYVAMADLGKVKLDAAATAQYLENILQSTGYISIDNDGEQMTIEGVGASNTEVKAHSTANKIIRATNIPRITPKDKTPPNIGGYQYNYGVRVTPVDGGAYIIYSLELYLKGMADFSSVEHTVKIPGLYNDNTKLMSIPQLAQLLQQYTMSLEPTQLGASGNLQTTLKVYQPDGTQLTNLTTSQFSVVAIGGYVTNATFSGSGSSITATLTLNPLAPNGQFGQEYGNAIVLWDDGNGHSADRIIRVIWDTQNSNGLLQSIVVNDWPTNEDLNGQGDYLVFKPGSGIRLYHYHSGTNQYCYEDYAGLNGACLSTRS